MKVKKDVIWIIIPLCVWLAMLIYATLKNSNPLLIAWLLFIVLIIESIGHYLASNLLNDTINTLNGVLKMNEFLIEKSKHS